MSLNRVFNSRKQRWAALFVVTLLAVGGCRTIPDLKPFAEAMAEIDLAANQTHDFIVADLTVLTEQAPNSKPQDRVVRTALEGARDAFSREWKIRLEATAALVDYSASLAGIAEAGISGGESARALARSVNGLLGSIPNVTAQIPAAAIDVSAWIKAEVDKVRAAASLAAAVKQADSVIKEIAIILAADFATVVVRINGNVAAAQALVNYQYGSVPVYRESLIARQDAVAAKIAGVDANAAIPPAYVAEATLVADLLKKIEREYRAYREAYDGAANRGITEREIATKAQDAIRRWAKLHGAIDEALAEKRVPSTATLANKALELKELVDKLKGEDS